VACVDGGAALLRPGGIPAEDIETALGRPLTRPAADPAKPAAPGMLESHYAPRAQVRLNAAHVEPDEALLAFGPQMPSGAEQATSALNLSRSGDLVEAAANLFTYLRRLDASGAGTIAVAPVPETGIGDAINDRLHRAAAPR
jgi:L-threonylcarbamoyladenylate synthase